MNTHIKELDGIRGIAILMVLVWHYINRQSNHLVPGSLFAYLHIPTTAFWSGVDLFFVLSGFLIGGIILDDHNKEGFLKVFWIRRCCRILPVLFLLLFSCWTLQSLLDSERYKWLFNDLMPGWSYLTFSQNILMGLRNTFGGQSLAITWSLAVEEQFYIFAPILILLFGKSLWIRALLPLIVFAFVLRLAFPGFHTYTNTIFRMDALLMGVFVAVLMRDQAVWGFLEKFKMILFVIFIGSLLITGALTISSSGFGHFKFSWFALLYSAFLMLVLLYRGSLLTSPLRSPFLCFWGSIAYGLYMYHQIVSGLLHGWLFNGSSPSLETAKSATVTAIAFLSSTGIAWISAHTLEAFFLRISKQSK